MDRLFRSAKCSGQAPTQIPKHGTYHHARFHKDWRDANSSEFALNFLPPYSPDLNPVEQVWKLTGRICADNRRFSALDNLDYNRRASVLQMGSAQRCFS